MVNYEETACLQDFFYTEVVFQAYYSKLEWMNNMVKSLYYFGLKEIVQLFSVRGSYFQNFDFCLASSLSRFYLDPCKRKTGSLFKHRHDPARVWTSSMNNYQVLWVVKDSLDLTMIENVYLTSSMSHAHLLAPSSF